jgi:cell division protein FtsQ
VRRPQGFEGPPQPAHTERPAGVRGSSERARREVEPTTDPIPVQPPRGGGFSVRARAEASADQELTQPIEPPTGATRPEHEHDSESRREAEPAPAGEPTRDHASRTAPDAGAAPRSAAAEVRAARRALARARSARRKYERQEVRRFTERSRRRRRTWLIAVGSVLVVCLGLLGAAYSPLMALREVRVEGATRIQPAQIQSALAPALGTPLPLITSADVRTALEGFPLIETYSIETLPPGTLIVRIVERTPVGVVETPNGLELVDAAGVVIDRPAERPQGEPLLSAGPVTSEGFRSAAAVIRSLPADVRGQVVRATAETADDVRLELAGGATVVWGSSEESTTKATVLASLMRNAPADTVAQYDVSAPMSPVTSG